MSSLRILQSLKIGNQVELCTTFIAKRFLYATSTVVSATGTKKREFILTEKVGKKKNVGLITFNRPKVLNALSEALLLELGDAIQEYEKDSEIGSLIITGNGKAFAAGADIKGMQGAKYHEVFKVTKSLAQAVTDCSKPIIAAVNGYALGGGCEIAMMCDIIYASELAKFGQPEILIGTIPGAGGTQRLIRAVGKSRAMEICLTGGQITATEAESMGLISRVFSPGDLIPEALKVAEKMSSLSKILLAMCKESVNNAYEMTLKEGLEFERRLNHLTFATEDQREGMTAFVEKRAPKFQDK